MLANRKGTRFAIGLLILALVVSAFGIVGAQDSTGTPFLGIGLSPADNGVKVEDVQAESPAAKAGLKVGDIITAIDGKAVTSETISGVVAEHKVGDEIKLAVTRDTETLELSLTLGVRPAGATEPPVPTMTERPMLGIQIENSDNGPVIRAVAAGSPAEKAGLKVDDILTKIGDTEITDAGSAVTAVQNLTVGTEVAVEVTRGNETVTVNVTPEASTGMNITTPMHNSLSVTFNEADKSWTLNNVAEQSELYKAGLRTGDKITLFDGTAYDAAGLREYLSSGDKTEVALTVNRDGKDQEIKLPVSALILFDRGAFDMTPGEFPFFNMPFNRGGGSRLGVEFLTLNADVAKEHDVTETVGALVTTVMQDSPAEKAGLKANDVVVSVDGDKVDEEHTLRDRLFAYEPGDTVKLEVMREGTSTEIEVTLEQMPMSDAFPFFNQDGHSFQFQIPAPQQPQEPALSGTSM
ncbi:MAG: PDZ domain-containing protein [Chloroflexi bacterium]|nr:PDZ domain-containing protein [Chloroflexota bacterium]MCC6892392.1 PDZ domain-containing protein [Anaerolineae bacterium]